MADKPASKSSGSFLTRKVFGGKVPMWVVLAVAAVGLYLGYRWYENRAANTAAAATSTPTSTTSGGTTTSPTSTDTGTSGTTASSGDSGASGNSDLDAAIAALLGEQGANIGAIGSLGTSLADVATTAEEQLGYLSSETTVGAFQLAQTSVESNTALAQQALAANQPTTSSSAPATGAGGSGGGPAPAPSNTPSAYAPTDVYTTGGQLAATVTNTPPTVVNTGQAGDFPAGGGYSMPAVSTSVTAAHGAASDHTVAGAGTASGNTQHQTQQTGLH